MGLPPSSKKTTPNTSDIRRINPDELRAAVGFDSSKLVARAPTVEATVKTPEQIEEDIKARLNIQRSGAPVTPRAAAQAAAAPAAPKAKVPSFLETTITDEMVMKLSEELGLAPPVPFYEGTVTVAGTPLRFHYRLPDADDNLWAMGVVVAMAETDDRSLLLRTPEQLATFSSHLVACMCILSLQDKPVWDHLKQTDRIKSMVPSWNGTTWRHIPLVIRSIMAQTLYGVFSRTNADLLTNIDDVITAKLNEPVKKKESEENPTTAT